VSKKSWWALIPAGGLTTIGLVVAMQFFKSDAQNTLFGFYTGILLLGFSLTFGILWLRRNTQPTRWAIYPALGLFVLAIVSFILGNSWNTLADQTKAITFAVASVVFFVCYLVTGLRKWGWLFPALFCAAMSLTLWMSINNMEDTPWISLPILASIALPFYLGFVIEPKNRWLLIPAFIMTMVMVISMATDSDYEGVVVMFTFSLPFFAVYFWSKKNWWAFIPGGVFASIGVVSLLETVVPHTDYIAPPFAMEWGVYTWVLFLGFATTFGILWLQRRTIPTEWTGYLAVGFLAMAILSFFLGERFQELWLACLMLVSAGVLLLASLSKRIPSTVRETPEINI
jgi:hypothetical protein